MASHLDYLTPQLEISDSRPASIMKSKQLTLDSCSLLIVPNLKLTPMGLQVHHHDKHDQYDDLLGFDYQTCNILVMIKQQHPVIPRGLTMVC